MLLTVMSGVQSIMQAYSHAQAILFRHAEDGSQLGLPPHRTCFERGSKCCLLAYVGAEYEIYAAFHCLMDKAAAARTCHRLCVWLKSQQNDLFAAI